MKYLIATISLGIVVAAIWGLYAIGYPERLDGSSPDPRCESPVDAYVGDFRIVRVDDKSKHTIREHFYFDSQFYNLRKIFIEFQKFNYGTSYDDVIRVMSEYDNMLKIDDVTSVKILPPGFDFLEMPYHNFTMGNKVFSHDIDGDGLTDPIFSTAETRCSQGRLDILIPSKSISATLHEEREDGRYPRLNLSSETALFLNSSAWSNQHENERVPSYLSNRSSDLDGNGVGDVIYNGRVLDGAVLRDAMKKPEELDIEPTSPPSGWPRQVPSNSVILQEKNGSAIVAPRQGGLSVWRRGADRQDVSDDLLAEGSTIHPIPDVDGDGSDEILLIEDRSTRILLSGARYATQNSAEISTPRGQVDEVGGIGDFDSDGRNDFWMTIPRAFDDQGRLVGEAYLLLNSSLQRLTSMPGRVGNIEEIAATSVSGAPEFPNPGPNRMGSDLPPRSGDIDGDGLMDFITVTHYEFNNAGVVYVLPGKTLMQASDHKANDPYIVKIIGNPLTYIGTGIAVADFDGDGLDDILVGADVDHEAGFGAGAIYLLSGDEISSMAISE